jgi:Plasmid pRiA4b ORF-3-like protein
VPSNANLRQLHKHSQAAFGWSESHLWAFETPVGDYGVADAELGHRDAASRRLDDVALRANDRLGYTYDFGDGWTHDIVVEDVLTAEPVFRRLLG